MLIILILLIHNMGGLYTSVFFMFFLQCSVIFIIGVFHQLDYVGSWVCMYVCTHVEAIGIGIVFLNSFLASSLLVYRKAAGF